MPITIKRTDPNNWMILKEGDKQKNLPKYGAIPYQPMEGEGEHFDVNLPEEDLPKIKGDFRDIRYEKVHEYLMPKIQGEGYWDWLAVQTRNQIIHHIRSTN